MGDDAKDGQFAVMAAHLFYHFEILCGKGFGLGAFAGGVVVGAQVDGDEVGSVGFEAVGRCGGFVEEAQVAFHHVVGRNHQ